MWLGKGKVAAGCLVASLSASRAILGFCCVSQLHPAPGSLQSNLMCCQEQTWSRGAVSSGSSVSAEKADSEVAAIRLGREAQDGQFLIIPKDA